MIEILLLLLIVFWIGWVIATWGMIGYGVKRLFDKRKD